MYNLIYLFILLNVLNIHLSVALVSESASYNTNNPFWTLSLKLNGITPIPQSGIEQRFIFSTDNLLILDQNNNAWIIDNHFEIDINIKYLYKSLGLRFIGNYYNAYEEELDQSNHRPCDSKIANQVCCSNNKIRIFRRGTSVPILLFAFAKNPNLVIKDYFSAEVNIPGYPTFHLDSQNNNGNNSLGLQLSGMEDTVQFKDIENRYYLAINSIDTSMFLIPISMVGHDTNQIGITMDIWKSKDICNNPLGYYIKTNMNSINDQFKNYKDLLFSKVYPDCVIDQLNSNFQVASSKELQMSLNCKNFSSVLRMSLDTNNYSIHSNPKSEILNSGITPLINDTLIASIYVDIHNSGAYTGTYTLKPIFCCNGEEDDNCNSIRILQESLSLNIEKDSTKRYIFDISNDFALDKSGYCKLSFFDGIKFNKNIRVNFSTTVEQYKLPPLDPTTTTNMMTSRYYSKSELDAASNPITCQAGYVLGYKDDEFSCVRNCTVDEFMDYNTWICIPKKCKAGTYFNQETRLCGDIPPNCDEGYYFDKEQNACVPSYSPPPEYCKVSSSTNCTSGNEIITNNYTSNNEPNVTGPSITLTGIIFIIVIIVILLAIIITVIVCCKRYKRKEKKKKYKEAKLQYLKNRYNHQTHRRVRRGGYGYGEENRYHNNNNNNRSLNRRPNGNIITEVRPMNNNSIRERNNNSNQNITNRNRRNDFDSEEHRMKRTCLESRLIVHQMTETNCQTGFRSSVGWSASIKVLIISDVDDDEDDDDEFI
ncbi:hypothetical protein PPL_03358 [Heterostelium album PN500]|uniref:Uncharacterized protein n=1 Tax=Heterostelium pallidum (strain ATCC 26659 / Pp 5 / PN500) TaxID=670386 RepID=D3B4N3_HETP5|nr:hypothetical protein PPL_03358 [Heterostelium album PN500]EFA84281.1 hypothetical protein PPL_03358 [Heterostelium album PN500]|eukprot:XP_020436397.1 hypothetical protein PPL_03358 [Heterostelium album PN500]